MAKIFSAAIFGLDCQIITVEVDVASKGLAAFQIVGLPDAAINESRERVRTAIVNANLSFPSRRIIVNLAPADLAKSGPVYDLPIAIGLLIASGQLENFPPDSIAIGELALDGALRSVPGVLAIVLEAKNRGLTKIFLPKENAIEASFVSGIEIIPIKNLIDINKLNIDSSSLKPFKSRIVIKDYLEHQFNNLDNMVDFSVIKGQFHAKRALEIAAAGSHNLIFHGPPGSGKTLLARTLPSIMPKMTEGEVLEITRIFSISGLLNHSQPIVLERPFRSPHHTCSAVSLIGGSSQPKPGEITLAHRGVLFLDELPEFHRDVLESLRGPLEDKFVTVTRVAGSCQFPAQFILVAAYNPCPCGNLYDPVLNCRCSQAQILRYQKKLSGPLLDRIDLHIEVPRVKTEELFAKTKEDDRPNSSEIRQKVQIARDFQAERFKGERIFANSEMNPKQIERFCNLSSGGAEIIKSAVDRMNLSARGYHRVLKVARTIADLEQSTEILESHLTEALQYRPANP